MQSVEIRRAIAASPERVWAGPTDGPALAPTFEQLGDGLRLQWERGRA